ncbi:MAG: PAS domain S-box protein [Bacteroidia bacterium]|nr:PAS domain S-box protein [Bacteroidia bacterium]
MIRTKLLKEHSVLVQMLEALGDAVIVSDIEGKIIYWNKQSEVDFGFTSAEALGNTINLITTEQRDGTSYAEVWDRLLRQTTINTEVARKCKDGSIIWVQVRITLLRDSSEQPLYIIGVSRNVTEDILKKNKLLVFEAILESIQEGVLITEESQGGADDILLVNKAFIVLSGLNQTQLKSGAATVLKSVFPEWNWSEADSKSISQFEVKRDSKAGTRFLSLITVPVIDNHGSVSHRMIMLRDITHLRMREDQLQIQNRELKSTNMELDRMVYGVSHDLRAPLNSIIGLTNLMKKESYGKEASPYIDRIAQSAERLNDFINNIIQYSKNNRKVPSIQKIDFGELFNISADLHRYTEAGQKIAFQYINKERIVIESDKDRWQIIFNNLIGNSIKFSRSIPNSYVKVVVTRNESAVLVSVEDNGTGIPKDRMDSVFDMFYRADNIRSGSGLGLYIVRETVQALGGEISVESQVNSMTKFTISIPLKATGAYGTESYRAT